MRGTMLWFNEANDTGFISTETGERLAVHGSGFHEGVRPQGRCAGRAVVFEVSETGGERCAQAVRLEEDTAPRRARRRGAGR